METGDTLTVGAAVGSTGDAKVSGSGSRLAVGNFLNVGTDGAGGLSVTAGGVVETTASGSLGTNAGGVGDVLVQGAGSQWSARAINVGFLGSGTLTVEDGGVVTSTDGVGLGVRSGSSGTLTLTNGGTLRTTALFGGDGTARANLNGGTLEVAASNLTTALNVTLGAATTSRVDTAGNTANLDGTLSGAGAIERRDPGL